MRPSRQLTYFLLGLILPFIALRLVYAGTDCPGSSDAQQARANFETYIHSGDSGYAYYCDHFYGYFESGDTLPNWIYDDTTECPASGSSYVIAKSYSINGKLYVIIGRWIHGSGIAKWKWGVSVPDGDCDVSDSDGDGLPDNCDAYPDDSTPYSVKLTSFQTSDSTYDGERVRECYETDRDDTYCIGAAYNESLTDYLVYNGTWKDPSDICGSSGAVGDSKSDPADGEGTVDNPPITSDTPSGDAPADTDPSLESGTKSDGTETDNEALRGILDNTGDIASNTKRLGEYMNDLNTAIQTMNRNIAIETERAEEEETEKQEQEEEAQEAKESFENFDVEDALSGQIDPTITEGPEGDYQAHGDLADETWVTEFISSNPITTVLNQSGFQYSDSRCTANLNLGYLGEHSINICDLEDGFIAFGNLLVALTTLTGLIHVVTGRGFK